MVTAARNNPRRQLCLNETVVDQIVRGVNKRVFDGDEVNAQNLLRLSRAHADVLAQRGQNSPNLAIEKGQETDENVRRLRRGDFAAGVNLIEPVGPRG